MALPPRTAAYAFTSSVAAALVLGAFVAYTGPQNLGEVLRDSPPILSAPIFLGVVALGLQSHAAVGRARPYATALLFASAAWIWGLVLALLALVAAMQALD